MNIYIYSDLLCIYIYTVYGIIWIRQINKYVGTSYWYVEIWWEFSEDLNWSTVYGWFSHEKPTEKISPCGDFPIKSISPFIYIYLTYGVIFPARNLHLWPRMDFPCWTQRRPWFVCCFVSHSSKNANRRTETHLERRKAKIQMMIQVLELYSNICKLHISSKRKDPNIEQVS